MPVLNDFDGCLRVLAGDLCYRSGIDEGAPEDAVITDDDRRQRGRRTQRVLRLQSRKPRSISGCAMGTARREFSFLPATVSTRTPDTEFTQTSAASRTTSSPSLAPVNRPSKGSQKSSDALLCWRYRRGSKMILRSVSANGQ